MFPDIEQAFELFQNKTFFSRQYQPPDVTSKLAWPIRQNYSPWYYDHPCDTTCHRNENQPALNCPSSTRSKPFYEHPNSWHIADSILRSTGAWGRESSYANLKCCRDWAGKAGCRESGTDLVGKRSMLMLTEASLTAVALGNRHTSSLLATSTRAHSPANNDTNLNFCFWQQRGKKSEINFVNFVRRKSWKNLKSLLRRWMKSRFRCGTPFANWARSLLAFVIVRLTGGWWQNQ